MPEGGEAFASFQRDIFPKVQTINHREERHMGFAVLHIEKGSGNATGLGSHIDRTKQVLNADPERTWENFYLRYDPQAGKIYMYPSGSQHGKLPLGERIKTRIATGYTGKTAIRKDAVTHLNIVLTGSHKEMQDIAKNPERLRQWATDNLMFVNRRYGSDNIMEFAVHMDERTPHIHCVVVPLTRDGRLSAKEVMGDRRAMSKLQEEYGRLMQERYGLQRGIQGSTATHDSIREYYARVNRSMEAVVYKNPEIDVFPPRIETPPLLGREKWAKTQNKAISESFLSAARGIYHQVRETAEKSVKDAQNESTKTTEALARMRKENAQLRGQDKRLHPEHYNTFGKRLSENDSRFKAAILHADIGDLLELHTQGYKPERNFFKELARDKAADQNTLIAANHIFGLNALQKLEDIKLARSERSDNELNRRNDNRPKIGGM